MTSFRRQILLKAFKVFDLLVMAFSFALAASTVSYRMTGVSLGDFLGMRIKVQNFVLLLGFLLAWHLIFSAFGLYHSQRLANRLQEAFAVVKTTVLGTLFIIIMAVIFNITMITKSSPIQLLYGFALHC